MTNAVNALFQRVMPVSRGKYSNSGSTCSYVGLGCAVHSRKLRYAIHTLSHNYTAASLTVVKSVVTVIIDAAVNEYRIRLIDFCYRKGGSES